MKPVLIPMPHPPTENLWTWRELAAYLNVSKSWVYEKAAAGILPSLKVCGALRFDPAAIRTWVVSRPANNE
jgi:excisionase family DNA binding protein